MTVEIHDKIRCKLF